MDDIRKNLGQLAEQSLSQGSRPRYGSYLLGEKILEHLTKLDGTMHDLKSSNEADILGLPEGLEACKSHATTMMLEFDRLQAELMVLENKLPKLSIEVLRQRLKSNQDGLHIHLHLWAAIVQ